MSDDTSAAYWAGAARGRLVLQRCASCGTVRHYPRVLCAVCWSFDVEHVEAAGHGTVHSWTVAHHAFTPEVADHVPYVLATLDLPEGVRVMGRLDPSLTPATGLPVRIGFAPGMDGTPVPMFTTMEPGPS